MICSSSSSLYHASFITSVGIEQQLPCRSSSKRSFVVTVIFFAVLLLVLSSQFDHVGSFVFVPVVQPFVPGISNVQRPNGIFSSCHRRRQQNVNCGGIIMKMMMMMMRTMNDDHDHDDDDDTNSAAVSEVTKLQKKTKLSNNSDDDDDDDDAVTSGGTLPTTVATTTSTTSTTTASNPTANNGENYIFVQSSIGDVKTQIVTIAVTDGQYIADIKKTIKAEYSPALDAVSTPAMLLYTSPTTKIPIDSLEKWTPNVQWGKPEKPLIVKVSPNAVISTNVMMDRNFTKQINRAKLFINSILKPFEDIPNSDGMKVLRDVISLETGRPSTVVIRNITEAFWNAVIDKTNEYRVCAVGTPGIGKTTSTCVLIRLLLQRNEVKKKTVIYHVRKKRETGVVYVFKTLGTEGDIEVSVIPQKNFSPDDETINQPNVYYVVDPGRTKDNCNLPDDFEGKVIIVASPDEGHWGGGDFEKERYDVGTFLFFPVWSLKEMISAKDHFNKGLSDDEIGSRYEHVGGIPRHIFTKKATFEAILLRQKAAINGLTNDQLTKMTTNDMDSVQTFGTGGQPKSALMVYKCPSGNFEKFVVDVASEHILRLIVASHMQFLWNLIIDQGVERYSVAWRIFETYCENKMLGEAKEYFDYKHHNGTKWVLRQDETSLMLGGCSVMKGTSERLIVAASREERVVFYSLDRSYKLIDFVYRVGSVYYAFQVTIGKSHSCNTSQLEEVAEEAGGASKLILFYLVYNTRFKDFTTLPANPIELLPSDDWNLNVVCVPSPDDDHKGPSAAFIIPKQK